MNKILYCACHFLIPSASDPGLLHPTLTHISDSLSVVTCADIVSMAAGAREDITLIFVR